MTFFLHKVLHQNKANDKVISFCEKTDVVFTNLLTNMRINKINKGFGLSF